MTDKEKKVDTATPSGHVPRSALAAVAGRVEMAGSLPGSAPAPMRGLLPGQRPVVSDVRGLREIQDLPQLKTPGSPLGETSLPNPRGEVEEKLRRGIK